LDTADVDSGELVGVGAFTQRLTAAERVVSVLRD
jgi:hypothetical protein